MGGLTDMTCITRSELAKARKELEQAARKLRRFETHQLPGYAAGEQLAEMRRYLDAACKRLENVRDIDYTA